MNRSAKPTTIRFYVDADVLGLAKILVQMRPDVTYPGDPGGAVKGRRIRPACPITDPGTPDPVWIQETARRQWLIITRDRRIQDHPAEIEAVRVSGARMVNLSGAEALDTFHQMEALMCQWQKVYALLDERGPFIYSLTRTTLRPLPLHL
jgi:hypothetical protein